MDYNKMGDRNNILRTTKINVLGPKNYATGPKNSKVPEIMERTPENKFFGPQLNIYWAATKY